MKLVITHDRQGWGGLQRILLDVALGLRARGHEVVASCRPGSGLDKAFREHGLRTSGVRPRGDLDVISRLRFRRWLARERPDALFIGTWKRMHAVGRAGRATGVRRIATTYSNRIEVPPGRRYRGSFRDHIDVVVANARELKTAFLEQLPWFPAGRVHVVYTGIVAAPARDPTPIRGELGVGAGERLVLAAGRLVRQKGFDLLLEAFAMLSDPRLRLAVAGEGPDAGELRARADGLGIADRVRWLGFRADLDALMGAADVFVLSSRWEGMAVALMEALAAGVPVVATDVTGVREAAGAASGRPAAAVIVPAGSATALVQGVRSLLDELDRAPGAVAQRVVEGRARVAEWFTVEGMIDGYARALFGAADAP